MEEGGFVNEANAKKERAPRALLDAGLRLFLRYGLRRTSMEAIADDAQVAKATAYAYFPNKNAVFTAVVEDVLQRLLDEAEAAAEAAPDPLKALERSVQTKFVRVYELVHASTEGRELLQATNQLSAKAVAEAHGLYCEHLAKLLVQAELVDKRKAPELAEVLDAAADGVVARASSKQEAQTWLTVLVQRFAAGHHSR